MSVVDIDREERRSEKHRALAAGEDLLPHPDDCRCQECKYDECYGAGDPR